MSVIVNARGVLISAFILLFSSSAWAFLIPPPEPYWQIDETEWENNGSSSTYYFTIENQHQTESISGFAVGLLDSGEGTEVHGPYPEWRSEKVFGAEAWDTWTGWSGLGDPGWTLADFFGASWDAIFGTSYTQAAVYWSNQDAGSPGSIAPGEVVALDGDGFPLFYYVTYSGPASPAAVRLDNGQGFQGQTGSQNLYSASGGNIPAPAPLVLLCIGIAALTLQRRGSG